MQVENRNHYTIPVTRIQKSDCIDLIKLALQEDAPDGDPTSESIFDASQTGSAKIIAREAGIVCGLDMIPFILDSYLSSNNKEIVFSPAIKDSQKFGPGEILGEFHGSIIAILKLERIILNFLQYLSGISTTVDQIVTRAGCDIAILDTRKTLPGYRRLSKYAVFCGGGTNHRIHLSDMAMIKDNHIRAAGGIKNAILKIREKKPSLPLNVEVDNLEQLKEILDLKVDVILLDNMRDEILAKAVQSIQSCKTPALIEVSGGWKPEDLKQLQGLGKIGVSMGFLTHTTRFLDLGLDIL